MVRPSGAFVATVTKTFDLDFGVVATSNRKPPLSGACVGLWLSFPEEELQAQLDVALVQHRFDCAFLQFLRQNQNRPCFANTSIRLDGTISIWTAFRNRWQDQPQALNGGFQLDVATTPYSRHQPDSKQMGEGKDSCRLAMTVGMDRIRLNAQIGFHEPVNDVDGFLHARRNEVSKVCDVVVGNMAVGHSAHLAVTKVITSQQILLIEIVLGSIYSNGLPIAP